MVMMTASGDIFLVYSKIVYSKNSKIVYSKIVYSEILILLLS